MKAKNRIKYFCIGQNKTGTTSLKKAFVDLGFIIGNQRKAEILFDRFYFKKEFDPIVKYCESAQVFQDVPFSCPETFKYLDLAYPGSKFILTVRDNPDVWYRSITKFHSKKFGKEGRIPTSDDLKKAPYIRVGALYNTIVLYGTPDNDPYNKDILVGHYNKYNQDVIEYFKERPEDLLVLNVGKSGDYKKFIDFLGVDSTYSDFPWENKT